MEGLAELLGESPAIEAVRESLRRLLARPQSGRRLPAILIRGETGTGKGLVARLIHRHGPRAGGPFVDVNCAAIPDTLLEAELFGFERGAFTDARRAKPGLFQTAHRGTIFLDEVGLLPEPLQAKLLKVLEEQAVRRLGSTASEPVDVWVISATNADLGAAIAARRFREDLYHRLAVLTVELPPLRERGRDVLLLAARFLERACADYGLPPKTLAPAAQARLLAYPWPGNIRELGNMIERVALLAEGPVVGADSLELPAGPAPRPGAPAPASLEDAMREHLVAALTQTGWNISRTAALLGISRNTLRARIEKFGLRGNAPGAPPTRPAARPATAPAPAEPQPEAPAPAPAAAAPLAIRWANRRVTLLRATLILPEGKEGLSDTGRALDTLLDKARSFGGRIDELGRRGIGVVFGLEPVEDAPRRAAHAAMAIQKAAERGRRGDGEPFAVKVGIHVGQLLVGQSSLGTEMDAEAKRAQWTTLDALLAPAEADSIVVSGAAAPFLERRFDLGPVIREEGAVYRLEGRERKGLALEGEMAWFVGRRQELDLLKSRLASARAGRGQIVGIAGEAGIGKSRLLYEFRQALRGEAITYVEGHCLSYGSAIPYLPAVEILRHACRITDADAPETVARKLRVSLQHLGMDPEINLPYLLQFLGIKDGTEALPPSTPEAIRDRTFQILRQMCVSACRQRPLIIAVEDMHWIDSASETLGGMVESLEGVPLLLIVTYRPGYQAPWLGKSHVTQIALQPLSAEDSLSVLGGLLPPVRLAEPVAQLILSKAEGNPFFLEELARTVREQGGLSPTVTVPDTVQEVLLARINRLPDRERRLLQSAAVIGKAVPVDVLRAIAELPEPELSEALAQLRAADFLYEASPGPDVEYTFKHAVTHEVAYGSLRPEQRRALHARIVDTIEGLYPDRVTEYAERLAHHAVSGEVWDRAVDYLREAGARAFGRGAVQETLDRYEQALAISERLPKSPDNMRRSIDVRVDLHTPLLVLGQIPRLVELYGQAEPLARELDDPSRRWRVFQRISQYSWMQARYQDGLDYARRSLDIGTAINDPDGLVLATHSLAQSLYSVGRYQDANEHWVRILDGAEAERSKRLLVATVSAYIASCGWLGQSLTHVGDLDRALTYSARGIQVADESEHPQAQAMTYTLAAMPHVYKGDVAQALALTERALNLCESKGLLTWLPGASATLGWVLTAAGRVGDALPYLERGPSILSALGLRTHLSLMYTWWAEGLLLAGRLEEARQVAGRAVEAAVTYGEKGYEAEGYYVTANVLAAGDAADREAAAARYEQAQALAETLGMRPLIARCHLGLGRLYAGSGNHAKAAQHLTTAAGLFREMGMRLWLEQTELALSEGR